MVALPLPPPGFSPTHIIWEGGWLQLDASVREQVNLPGEVTEHPVDEDSDVSDHFRARNIPIIIDAVITNTPSQQPLTHTGGSVLVPSINVIEIQAPIFPGAPTNIAGFGDLTTRKAIALQSVDFKPEMNRVQNVYEEIEAMHGEARFVTVALSRFRTFDNLILVNVGIDRENGNAGGMELVLEFKQIKLVAAATTLIEIPKLPKSPRSENSKDAGSNQTKVTENPSILKRIFG